MEKKRIFQSEIRAWVAVFLYTVVLYSTLTVVFDVYVSVYGTIGKATMSRWINLAFAALGIVLLAWILFCIRPKVTGYVALVLIFLTVAFCLYNLSIPAKRFHFLQYAPLALLVFDAVGFRSAGRAKYIWAITLVALIGLGDETIQLLLPDRHFGLLDVFLNSVAGLLMLVFIGFVWGEENYPEFVKR